MLKSEKPMEVCCVGLRAVFLFGAKISIRWTNIGPEYLVHKIIAEGTPSLSLHLSPKGRLWK